MIYTIVGSYVPKTSTIKLQSIPLINLSSIPQSAHDRHLKQYSVLNTRLTLDQHSYQHLIKCQPTHMYQLTLDSVCAKISWLLSDVKSHLSINQQLDRVLIKCRWKVYWWTSDQGFFSTHDPYGSYRVKHLLYHKDFLPFICTTLLCICQSKLHNSTIRKNELTTAVLIRVSWFSYVKDCSVTKHYTDVSIWVGLEPCHAWYISSVYDMCFMKPCIL